MASPNWTLNSIPETLDEWNFLPSFLRLNSSSSTEEVTSTPNLQEEGEEEEGRKEQETQPGIEDPNPKPFTSIDQLQLPSCNEIENAKPLCYLERPSFTEKTEDNSFFDYWCSKDYWGSCNEPWEFFNEPSSQAQQEPSLVSLALAATFQVNNTSSSNSVGAGLENLGNTCFMNAILQCLTHTVPLVQGLRACNHSAICDGGIGGFCVICALHDHIERSIAASGRTVSPVDLANNLHKFSFTFRRFQQEDAHEFMTCALDKLETGFQYLKEKISGGVGLEDHFNFNLVKNVFGGRLMSRLRCSKCGHSSDTIDPLIVLSLEIENVYSLQEALESFTRVENIDVKIRCDSCHQRVYMEKQLMLYETPSIAAFHLKRFKTDGNNFEKIDKHVNFPLELDLEPYSFYNPNNDETLNYELYAVVVHTGFSIASGHYYCYVRSAPEIWYKLDDSQVTWVDSGDTVQSQEAYILFYARQHTSWFASIM